MLRTWVAQGGRWNQHWSLIPPERPELPVVGMPAWPRNGIDHFVLARLEREKLSPAAEASRSTLLRRVSLDLTGLPPTPAEVHEFLRDKSPDAYEKAVDRLLASPRYGERMAIRWLDAARYADTNGYQTDAERYMWRWRDWVIGAFNSNMPFDRFTVEQIAGDLLPDATLDQKIATGFNRNHRGNSEGGIVPEEYLVEYAVDRVETMSTVFLGLTVGCARCHTHKYDPITHREFYQLFAYFNNIPEIGRYLKYGNTPPYVKAPTREQQVKIAALDKAVASAEKTFEDLDAELQTAQAAWERGLKPGTTWFPARGLAAHLALDEPGNPGVVGKSARFDGKRVVSAGDKGKFGFYDSFTAAAWIRPDAPDGPIITRAEDKQDAEGWGLYLVNNHLQVNLIKRKLDDSIRLQMKDPISLGEWHHVAMTYDGSRMATGVRVYVDGQPREVEIILDAINQDFATNEPLRVGAAGGFGPPFTGWIDEARVYARALPDHELAILAARRDLAEIAGSDKRTRAEQEKIRQAFLETAAPASIGAAWNAREQARQKRDEFLNGVQTVMVMAERPDPKDTFLLRRGAYDQPGEKVSRGIPAALPPLPAGVKNDRLALARWLVDPANPLTARVTVNRFWQMYFGTGIVKTIEDFGSQGEWPSHPELLDWLATEFVSSGWDVKRLQKTIVMSATYRQSSAVSPELAAKDPENRLLARGPRLRLPAEVVRDQALFVSGLLVEKIGGPSVKPYQPAGLWSELGGSDYEPDKGEGLYRRSIYTFWKRTAPPPFMANFDSAMRESCTVREARTNTPLQALNLMNDVTFVEAARKLAERVIANKSATGRLDQAFLSVLGRQPKPAERDKLATSLAFYKDHFASKPEAATKFTTFGDSKPAPGIEAPELAAWTALCSAILNLDEAVTKE
jgi:Protein of unknown function (DUF1553)/Protein of unknown function (DUF1549)/Concanavalin A-like lectin/glucanases superfamily